MTTYAGRRLAAGVRTIVLQLGLALSALPVSRLVHGEEDGSAHIDPPKRQRELIQNGEFDNGTYGWKVVPPPSARPHDGELCVQVPADFIGGSVSTSYQFLLTKNDVYTLKFRAYASAAQSMRVQTPDAPLDPNLDADSLPLTTNLKSYSLSFSPANQAPAARLSFSFNGTGTRSTTICVRDISLQRINRNDYHQDIGPAIKVNQLGFLPVGPKVATAVVTGSANASNHTQPHSRQDDFMLLDSLGSVVYSGKTTPWGLDASSGQIVATMDFTNYTTPGHGYTLVVAGSLAASDWLHSFPFAISSNIYDSLRQDSMQFFYQQRSGIAIDGNLVGKQYARAAGHIGVAPNQGDTAVPCQRKADAIIAYGEAWGCDYKLNVVKGWYDAGDQGKYVVNGGIATAQLLALAERRIHVTDVRLCTHLANLCRALHLSRILVCKQHVEFGWTGNSG